MRLASAEWRNLQSAVHFCRGVFHREQYGDVPRTLLDEHRLPFHLLCCTIKWPERLRTFVKLLRLRNILPSRNVPAVFRGAVRTSNADIVPEWLHRMRLPRDARHLVSPRMPVPA